MAAPQRSTIALTGASGHVGAAILRELRDRGHPVRVLARRADDPSLSPFSSDADVIVCTGSLEDRASLDRLVTGSDAVIHCAALVSLARRRADEVRRINVAGTETLIDAARSAAIERLVQVSSVHSYRVGAEVVDEGARRLAPGDAAPAYDASKAEAEALVLEAASDLSPVIVQPSSVLGPFDYKPSRLGKVLLSIARGRLPATLPGTFDFVDNRDVARGIAQALEHGRPGHSYLLTGHHLEVRELVLAAAQAVGRRGPRAVLPSWLATAVAPLVEVGAAAFGREPTLTGEGLAALASGVRFSSAKAEQQLGYRARPVEETLRDTYAWFRTQGALR